MVTHRLDQLDHMDTVMVLDQGAIVQQGSFRELDQTPGVFKQMQTDVPDFDGQVHEYRNPKELDA